MFILVILLFSVRTYNQEEVDDPPESVYDPNARISMYQGQIHTLTGCNLGVPPHIFDIM